LVCWSDVDVCKMWHLSKMSKNLCALTTDCICLGMDLKLILLEQNAWKVYSYARTHTFCLDKFICLPSHLNTNLELECQWKTNAEYTNSGWTYLPDIAGLISVAWLTVQICTSSWMLLLHTKHASRKIVYCYPKSDWYIWHLNQH
jgi:hypothetical protein